MSKQYRDDWEYMCAQQPSPPVNNSAERKNTPIYSGCIAYFPDAMRLLDASGLGGLGVTEALLSRGASELSFARLLAGAALNQLQALLGPDDGSKDILVRYRLCWEQVARLSKIGNDKHNPGKPLHHSRWLSTDHLDCVARHQSEYNKVDPETGLLHAVAVLWRALAYYQELLERECGFPLAPGAKLRPEPTLTVDDVDAGGPDYDL